MAKTTLSELVIRLSLEKDASLNTNLKATKKQIEDMSGEITRLAQSASIGFGIIAVAAGAQVKSMIDAKSAYEQYQSTLLAVTKNQSEANKLFKEAVEFAPKTPFQVQDIVKATVFMKSMGVEVDRTRMASANLASAFGTDLFSAVRAIAKACAGSADGFEILRNQYGVMPQELAKFGAVTRNGTEMIYAQAGAVEKNKEALMKLIQTKFGTAIELQMKTAKTAFSNFQDSVNKLQAAMGEQILPTFALLAVGATKVVEGINKLPGPIKALGAWGAVATAGIATLGVAATGLIAILPTLSAGWNLLNIAVASNIVITKANTFSFALNSKEMMMNQLILKGYPPILAKARVALMSMSAAAYASIGIVGAAALALSLYTDHLEKRNKKLQDSVDRDEKALKAARRIIREFAGKSTSDLVKMGVTVKQLENYITGMKATMKDAFEKGDFATGKWYKKQILKAKEYEKALAFLEKKIGDVTNGLHIVASDYKILSDSNYFKKASNEVNYLMIQINDSRNELRLLKSELSFKNVDFDFNFSNMKSLEKSIISIKKRLRDIKDKKSKGKMDPGVMANLDKEAKALKDFLFLLESYIKKESDVYKSCLDTSKDYIQKKKDLNQMNLQDEIKAQERRLQTAKKGFKEEKEILHEIAVLKRKMSIEAKETVVNSLKDELSAIENMTSGAVQAYDKLLRKIDQYQNADKISAPEAKKLKEEAQEKKQKESFNTMRRNQQEFLSEIISNENVSAMDRIRIYHALSRQWENYSHKNVKFHEKAQKEIIKLTKKRAAEEKRIIEANKEAAREIRDLQKDALDYDISKLGEQLKVGENVQNKIMEKIEQKHQLEMQRIKEQASELEKRGWTRENIEKKIAYLNNKADKDKLSALDQIIAKIRKAKDEAKKEESRPGQMMNLGEMLDYQKKLFHPDKKKEEASIDISALIGERDRIQRKIEETQRKLTSKEGFKMSDLFGLPNLKGLSGLGKFSPIMQLMTALKQMKLPKLDSGQLALPQLPLLEELKNYAEKAQKAIDKGIQLTPEQYQAVRSGFHPALAGAGAGKQQVINNYFNITINGEKMSGPGGFSFEKTSNDFVLKIPQCIIDLANSSEVKPIGREDLF